MKKTFKYAIGSLCTVFAMTAYACSDSNTTISSGEVSSEVSGDVRLADWLESFLCCIEEM